MMVRILVVGILAGALCAGCASPGASPESTSPEVLPSASGTSAGLRVYKDPQTGQFTDPPPVDTAATTSVDQSLNRSHEGLVAMPNTAVPGGGVRLDLQGRFRSHFIATKDADGKINIRCLPEDELPKP